MSVGRRWWVSAALLIATGCDSKRAGPQPSAHDAPQASVSGSASSAADAVPPVPPEVLDPTLVKVIDQNPDPRIVEVTLTAQPSVHSYGAARPTDVWSYNGTVPGPLVEAQVGDKLIAHLENKLPEATTIHWHGIRLPNAMDGNPMVVPPVVPGGTFRYEFTFKDAGLFWFHPHIRSDVQVQKGLQAPLLVRGPNEPRSDDERVLVIDDVRLKADGSLDEYLDDTGKMMGREGNVQIVNGHPSPTLRVRPGATLRLRLVNTANGRFFHLRVPGHRLHVIGTDGGLVPHPYETERLLMSPGERYDVMISVQKEPGTVEVWNDPHERGHESGNAPATVLWKLRVEGAPVVDPAPIPSSGPALERLAAKGAAIPIVLDEGSQNGEMVFTVNGKAHPDVPPIGIKLGETRFLHVTNASDMDHPFHLHGFFFQVVSRKGKPEPAERLANKDTLIVPMKSDLVLAARFDEAGRWMYHCHILEHAEAGMMGDIDVGARSTVPGAGKPQAPAHGHGHAPGHGH